jgi:hypothetical protein
VKRKKRTVTRVTVYKPAPLDLSRVVWFPPISREAERRLNDCVMFTAQRFELFAYPTRTLKARETLPGFISPESPPGQALGFRCVYSTASYVRPTGEAKPSQIIVSPVQEHRLEWATVVHPNDAMRGLEALIKRAQYMLALERQRAASKGSAA